MFVYVYDCMYVSMVCVVCIVRMYVLMYGVCVYICMYVAYVCVLFLYGLYVCTKFVRERVYMICMRLCMYECYLLLHGGSVCMCVPYVCK